MVFGRLTGKYRKWLVALAVVFLALPLALYVRGWFLLREFENTGPMHTSKLIADNGEIFATLGKGPAHYIHFEDIPKNMKNAIVAIEDRWFYKHPGFNPIAILRAIYVDFRARRKVLGASTITQQLAKNLFLTHKKTFTRKAEELILALVLEQRYTKNEILELYLNRIYFGKGSYGIEAAARTYLGKHAGDLSLPESALLAAIPRSPANYDPYVNPKLALERRNLVLERMQVLGMITKEELSAAAETPLELDRLELGFAPYFVDYVRKLLEDKYGTSLVNKGGLRVHTTLNMDYQTAAQKAFSSQDLQGALVAIDPDSGGIKAMVGGRDYAASQYNRATRAFRQPGSAFKPFIYAAALEAGWQQNTLVEDTPKEYAGYAPTNWQSQYWGPVIMKHAMAVSLNNAAVWTLNSVGVDKTLKLAKDMGISSLVPEDRNLSLALGGLTKGVSPLELAGAFVPFANGGLRYETKAIERVLDADGRVLESNPSQGVRVITSSTAYLITDMLKAVLEYGTGRNLPINRPAAGKTGTTDEKVSVWFAGYTPSLAAVVYIGNDQGEPLPGFGSSLAGPVWAEFLETALAEEPPWDFDVPRQIITGVPIHIFSGLLAGPECDWVVDCAFIQGAEPREYAPCGPGQSQADGAPAEHKPLPIPTPTRPNSESAGDVTPSTPRNEAPGSGADSAPNPHVGERPKDRPSLRPRPDTVPNTEPGTGQPDVELDTERTEKPAPGANDIEHEPGPGGPPRRGS
ncbi:MAG: PBP1A family penicillin-binding protein [Firmicutes bacterium]|nr:PBP1A family penicillin-binding protein [Bacillota bacterium]